MHGAGVIESIVKERVAGEVKEYYVFKMPMGGLLLKIPVANSEVIGVRGIISAGEADRLLTAIPDMAVENNSNWNKRISGEYAAVEERGCLSGGQGHQILDAAGVPPGAFLRESGRCSIMPGRS